MPGVLAGERRNVVYKGRAGRYFAYAVGEVFLIFVGITLAIAFENRAEQQRELELAEGLLTGVMDDLANNVTELERNIRVDENVLTSLARVLDHFAANSSWDGALNEDLGTALLWSSPFLASSGYESLKQYGIHLIPNNELRSKITYLFESQYGYLVGDHDRSMWSFSDSFMYPVQQQELVRIENSVNGRSRIAPRDYTASLASGNLKAMLLEHQSNLLTGLDLRKSALDETRAVSSAIEIFLNELN